MSTAPLRRFSEEEYLEREELAREKHEFYRGEIFAMPGSSFAHNRIAGAVVARLHGQLRGKPCEVLPSDMRITSPSGLFTYPDAVIVRGEPELKKHQGTETLLNPTVIIEVLSNSTERYDRGAKFELYQSIPSLAEYVLIAQDRPHIDHFARQSDGSWRLTSANGIDATMSLPAVGCRLSLAEVYEQISADSVGGEPRLDDRTVE
jgi:Uma2 family endonuclease